jgi:hypothetical protein
MFKTLLIFLVIAVLMEDSVSIRKTEEERKEEEELAERVNATLAEEEEKKRQEKEDEAKKKEDETKGKRENKDEKTGVKNKADQRESQSEADSLNCTCPVVKPCRPCQSCPVANCTGQCDSYLEKECPEIKPCEKCPEAKECLPVECPPVLPCPVDNSTGRGQELPSPPSCPEVASSMSVPVAMLVGACAGLLVTGVATAIGLLLRYASPMLSGFIFLATIIIVWYLSSQYPETARELGSRTANLLREAAVALGHRVMAAIRHHNEQVGFPVLIPSFLSLSSMFI